MTGELRVWLAWPSSGPSHKSVYAGVDHGTTDGKRTLCGVAVCGSTPSEAWRPGHAFSCKRCQRVFATRYLVPSEV